MKQIKICGITQEKEADYLMEAGVDYAGFIQYVPKSKRNITTGQAIAIMKRLPSSIRAVAVTISPTAEQIHTIEAAGFSLIQIHGAISDDLLDSISIPIIRAFNVNNLSEYERFHKHPNVVGYIFDAQVPGSGKTFDWSLISDLPRDDKFMLLAGGITPDNAAGAILATGADGIDISSGVENDNGIGKSREKILRLAKQIRCSFSS